MVLKRSILWGILSFVFLFVPAVQVFAEDNGDNGNNGLSLMEAPLIILAFATIILMIYYSIRD